MKTAAVVLVSVGTVGLVVTFGQFITVVGLGARATRGGRCGTGLGLGLRGVLEEQVGIGDLLLPKCQLESLGLLPKQLLIE